MGIRIALAGNPNSGKTTLFNALTGANQYVGNWPGVTVEKKEGRLRGQKDVDIVDLPGIYSLSPYTPEEVVARGFLAGQRPDAVINIVDGSNLERNLYLTTQLADLHIPMVVAVNMMDVLAKRGDRLDVDCLARQASCPVVSICALKGQGVTQLAQLAVSLARQGKPQGLPQTPFDENVRQALQTIQNHLPSCAQDMKRWYAVKAFEGDTQALQPLALTKPNQDAIQAAVGRCEKALDDDAQSIMTTQRYAHVTAITARCLKKAAGAAHSVSDRIDRLVTHRVWALPIFASMMFIVYYISVTSVGAWLTDWTNETLFGTIVPDAVGGGLSALGVAPWLKGLMVDGIIGGTGAVLGFVPQILVLFFFLALLEESGYMARVAFIMDRIFRRFGLSGKSFIPMLIGTGCSIPGIMASRTIENERDRRMTIITTSFMPCSAKLPIIALISGAVFGGAWWVAPSAYFAGIAAIIVSGLLLKKTRLFAGVTVPFVMELPAYHLPQPMSVLRSMWERGWSFIKKAGTIILLSSIVIWFASNFGFTNGRLAMVEDLADGFLAQLGRLIAPLFAPLGWGHWRASVATLTGLVAKENVISTMSILYQLGEDAAENQLWQRFAQDFSAAAAYSFLLFNLLCAPCFAAIGAIRREMHNAKWSWFAIAYQTGFAYVVALIVYQLAVLLGAAR